MTHDSSLQGGPALLQAEAHRRDGGHEDYVRDEQNEPVTTGKKRDR